MINHNIKGTGLDMSDELRTYALRPLERIEKFVEGDATAYATVECEYAAARDGGKYRAEYTVVASGQTFRAEEWGSTMHEAIDLAGNELFRELRREKRKKIHLVRRGAHRVKEYLRGWRSKV